MKKRILLLLFTIFYWQSGICQYNKGKVYFDANYRYYNNSKIDDGIGSMDINSTFSPNVGYFVNNNFVVGVGFNNDYWNLTQINLGLTGYMNGVLITKVYNANSDYTYGFSSSFFIKYIYPITHKLGVSIMIKSFIGGLSQTTKDIQDNVVTGNKQEFNLKVSKGNYSGVIVSPEVRYLITKKFGLHLNFNGYSIFSLPKKLFLTQSSMYSYSYTLSTKVSPTYSSMYSIPYRTISSTENFSKTSLNFEPTNWSIGVFLILGK